MTKITGKSYHVKIEADLLDNTYPLYNINVLKNEITRVLTKDLMLIPQNFSLEVKENNDNNKLDSRTAI